MHQWFPSPMPSFGYFQWEDQQGLKEERRMKSECSFSPDPFTRVCMGLLCLLANSHRFCLSSLHTSFPILVPLIAQSCLYNLWVVPITPGTALSLTVSCPLPTLLWEGYLITQFESFFCLQDPK